MAEEKESEIRLKEFKKWIENNPKLPKNIDNVLLQRYLKVYDDDNDMQEAKDLLLLNLTVRKSYSHLFSERDVLSKEIEKANSVIQICPLPKLTEDNCKVTIIRLTSDDISQFYYDKIIKMALMVFDCRFSMHDNYVDKIASGEHFIVDGKGFTLRQLFEIAKNISSVGFFIKYIQEYIPFNIKSFHVVNCSSVIDKIFALLRPIINKELLHVIHFHKDGLGDLHEQVPKDSLPLEFGGDLGTVDEMHRNFVEIFKSKREYLMNDDNWKLND